MINRRTALGIIASASTIGASGVTLAKEKHHLNGKALLGDKIKQNGKHKIHTAGKVDVFAEVNNGKVVGVSAAGMQVKKVKSRQKLAVRQREQSLLPNPGIGRQRCKHRHQVTFSSIADDPGASDRPATVERCASAFA